VLEATERFPQKLLDARPDFVFNIAEGRGGRAARRRSPRSATISASPTRAPTPRRWAWRSTSRSRSGLRRASACARRRRSCWRPGAPFFREI
jgi:hypothetical protein